MISTAEAKEFLDSILASGPKDAVVEALLNSTDQQLSRYGDQRIVQNVARRLRHVNLRVQRGKKQASLTVQQLDQKSIAKAYQELQSILSIAPENDSMLEILSEPQEYQSNDAFYESTEAKTAKARADWIGTVIAAGREHNVEISGRYQVDLVTTAYANSHGLFACHRNSKATLSATATSENGRGEGWGMAVVNDVNKLDSEGLPERLRDHAVGFANRAANPVSKPAGVYKVVLEPAAVAELLVFLADMAFSGRDFVDGRSYTSGKLGKKIFADCVNISADPFHPKLPGRAFDLEGVATQPTKLIENGVLKAVCWDRRSVRQANLETHLEIKASNGFSVKQPNNYGPVPRNLVLQGNPEKSLNDLVSSLDKGLLIKRFHYCNIVNVKDLSITGMTRSGVFEVEQGEITQAVNNFRFTVSLAEVLGAIEELSQCYRCDGALFGSELVAPALRLSAFRMTSTTENEAQ